LSDTATRLAH